MLDFSGMKFFDIKILFRGTWNVTSANACIILQSHCWKSWKCWGRSRARVEATTSDHDEARKMPLRSIVCVKCDVYAEAGGFTWMVLIRTGDKWMRYNSNIDSKYSMILENRQGHSLQIHFFFFILFHPFFISFPSLPSPHLRTTPQFHARRLRDVRRPAADERKKKCIFLTTDRTYLRWVCLFRDICK